MKPQAAATHAPLHDGAVALTHGVLWLEGSRALVAADVHLGYEDVTTILNSGNAVVTTSDAPAKAESRTEKAIASELGLKIQVMARTHDDLAAVVEADPLGTLVTNPSHYAVAFLRELRAPGSPFVEHATAARVCHLYHDREEFTVVGEVAVR